MCSCVSIFFGNLLLYELAHLCYRLLFTYSLFIITQTNKKMNLIIKYETKEKVTGG